MQAVSTLNKRSDVTRLTPRLLAMIANVARYGVLTSDQVARLDGGSRQKVTRHLQHTVESKLLRRVDRAPEAFLTSFFDPRPRAFAATAKGLRVLEENGIAIPVSPKRADVLIAHEVEIAEAMFSIAASVATRPDLRLIDQPELIAAMPRQTRELRRPLRLQAAARPHDFPSLRRILNEPTIVGVEPDRLIVIARKREHEILGHACCIEVDRGGEPLTARSLRRASWVRKTIGYVATWSSGLHVEQFGPMSKSMRILAIVPSLQRARNIIELQREIAPPGLFLFTTPERLRDQGVLEPIWVGARGDDISLLDRE